MIRNRNGKGCLIPYQYKKRWMEQRRKGVNRMAYDFETLVDRNHTGSAKYEQMKAWNPDAPEGTVPFSVADMELKTPPEIVESLKRLAEDHILGYTIATPAYLDAVCQWMKERNGWEVRPEWIVGSPGVVSAFFAAVRAFSEPGDGVIVMSPVYYPFYYAMERNGRGIVKSPLILDGDTYHIDFDDLENQAKEERNKVLLFCSPHNPVGRVWKREELARVAEICRRNHVLVVSDEIHSDLIMPDHHHTVFATLSEEDSDNVIVCTAPTKTFNLAGLQVSNLIIPNPSIRRRFSAEMESNGAFSLNVFGYRACETAYRECGSWLDALILHIHTNHRELKTFMAKNLPEIKVFDLEGTYLQWMDFTALGMDKDELEHFLHKEALIFFDEGYVFGEEGTGFERMNLACPTWVMMEGLERLHEAIRKRFPHPEGIVPRNG
jgi:aminotransferase/cystathionine beta-lyase